MPETPNDIYRDYNTAGDPSSGDYKPEKPRIRRYLNRLESMTALFGPMGFSFSVATADADPGAGIMRYNNASPALTTSLFIDALNSEGADVSAFIDTWDDSTSAIRGRVQVISAMNPAVFHIFDVTGAVTSAAGYRKVAVTYVAGSGVFDDADVLVLQFTPKGDEGDAGASGAVSVATRTALKALDTATNQVALLTEAGREGQFLWIAASVSAFVVGPTKTTSSVDSGTETLTFGSNHWFTTGQALMVTAAVNGLAVNTLYYAIRVSDTAIRLASSYADALAGTAFNLTGTTAITVRQHMDPTEGIYVCPTADLTGASGAWRRVRTSDGLRITWFGAVSGADSTQAINCAAEFQNRGFWSGSAITYNESYVLYPEGVFLVNPTVGIRLRDYAKHVGVGIMGAMVKAANTSAGNLFYRQKSPGAVNHERVAHVEISGIRGIVTGASQIIFNLEHIGRCEVHHVMGTTQDRDNEYNNANQRYHASSALFQIGVGDSAPNGYVNGSDIMRLHHFVAQFLGYGVRSAASAGMKAPEDLSISQFEISDCHEPIVLNASAAMMGYIGMGAVQRWGLEAINAATGLAGADNYGIDYVANKLCLEQIYFEGNSAFAAILTRSGTANIVKTARFNRYGTTTTIHSDGGTSTVTSD